MKSRWFRFWSYPTSSGYPFKKKSLFSNTSLNITSGLILTKIEKREKNRGFFFIFYQNRGLTLLEKSHFWGFEKLTFLQSRRASFLLMVFTVTSSDCKVKKARFYEFLFTLGWRLIGNKSLYKFPAPKHVSFRKYSNLNFRVFTVRDTKIGMLSRWNKVSPLDFQQYNHFKY